MRIEFELEGAGWATARLYSDDGSVTMTASYLNDPLRELADAARLLCKGFESATVSFVDEPGEHRLLLTRQREDEVEVEVRWYNDWAEDSLQTPFETVLRTRTTVKRFRKDVLDVLWHVRNRYGLEGYANAWVNSEFPDREYERLKAI